VKQPDTDTPAFLLREVELGPSLGDAYVVLNGIREGDEIVTNGAFTIDASAQLAGKRSMMNKEEGGEHAMLTVQGLWISSDEAVCNDEPFLFPLENRSHPRNIPISSINPFLK
jgi:hypothetical protein